MQTASGIFLSLFSQNVIPAQAGIHSSVCSQVRLSGRGIYMDSGFRRNDDEKSARKILFFPTNKLKGCIFNMRIKALWLHD